MMSPSPPPPASLPWDEVVEFTKEAQEKALDPLAWAIHVSSIFAAAGVELPSPDLAHLLVSHICWANNVPAAWKYLEKAVAARLAPPMLVIALLSTRVIPRRRHKPAAYRLYMEILKRHSFAFASEINKSNCKRILMSVDDILHLSHTFGIQASSSGVLVVEFIFCIIWQLLDAALDDEGLLDLTPEKRSRWANWVHDMEVDGEDNLDEKQIGYSDKLLKANTEMSIELIAQFFRHKVISRLLSLAHQNMQSHWEKFSLHLHLLATKSLALRNSTVSPDIFLQLPLNNASKICWNRLHSQQSEFCAISSMPLSSSGGHINGASQTSLWIPLDLYLEDALHGSVAATNAIEVLSGLVKALHAVNKGTWHDVFLSVWMVALRLVQRERNPIEGPEPRVDTRMCMLLSVMTLAIADLVEEEVTLSALSKSSSGQLKDKVLPGERHKALVSSLQMLGDYETLLAPPPSVISSANQAATKAMMVVSGMPVASGYFDGLGVHDQIKNCSGNLRHLIVEACIARNLLDTSAYYWPGYVTGCINQIPHAISSQVYGWPALMKGAPLSSSMVNALVNTPASSLAELEKIFEIAINGSDDEKISAATILCGASLIRGWNVQEHTVCLVVKLLSPSIPVDYSESDNHLLSHAPVLNAVLTEISSMDSVQIFSFHGLVPELAGALMPICEVFGSCMPSNSCTLPTGEKVSAHAIFSDAFLLLLRLWKFNHPPLEYCIMGEGAPLGSQLNPEYLLFLLNSEVLSCNGTSNSINGRKRLLAGSNSRHPIFVDMFPKLKVWYRQHQACLVSTLSRLVPGTPIHQNVDCLLNMMFRRKNKGAGQSVGPGTSGSSSLSNSSDPAGEDTPARPNLPAWDIMEAVPYVVDAALTACSNGRLSPRELATGLKDLADYFPASLGSMVSYFSAEVSRGVYKPASMNGTDWPSPVANLATVEENIKKIVAATGADVPSLVTGSSPATLPLPLAAFVSLTITYKLDKASDRFLYVAGPALEALAASCPWPSMAIVTALWAQKVKRWSDFLTFSASSTVFHHNNNAVVQLLKSCFSAALGISSSSVFCSGGVGSLLGHGFGSHFSGGLSPVAPGVLYLEIHRDIRDIVLLMDQILSTLLLSIRDLAGNGFCKETREKLNKSKYGMRYGHISLVSALNKVKVAACLGATLVWLSGGSGLVQCLFRETLPSWFLSVHESDQGDKGGLVEMLEGYALAYFAVLCGMFAWGIDSRPVSKRRSRVIGTHLEFLADALDGKISLGCSWATWHSYVSGFLGLMMDSASSWVTELDVALLKRLSRGLKHLNEGDLAFLLLQKGGTPAIGEAAEFIIASE